MGEWPQCEMISIHSLFPNCLFCSYYTTKVRVSLHHIEGQDFSFDLNFALKTKPLRVKQKQVIFSKLMQTDRKQQDSSSALGISPIPTSQAEPQNRGRVVR